MMSYLLGQRKERFSDQDAAACTATVIRLSKPPRGFDFSRARALFTWEELPARLDRVALTYYV